MEELNIVSLYRKMRARENVYPCMFHTLATYFTISLKYCDQIPSKALFTCRIFRNYCQTFKIKHFVKIVNS